MKSEVVSAAGSARVSRAGCGVSPQQTSSRAARPIQATEKSAMAGTPSPTRETRVLPGEIRTANI